VEDRLARPPEPHRQRSHRAQTGVVADQEGAQDDVPSRRDEPVGPSAAEDADPGDDEDQREVRETWVWLGAVASTSRV
jgi:hypothetical protein